MAFALMGCAARPSNATSEYDVNLTNQICNIKEGQSPLTVRSGKLRFEVFLYATPKIVGPAQCKNVKIYLSNQNVRKNFFDYLEYMSNARKNKDYHTFDVDGIIDFDSGEKSIRFNINALR